MTVLFTFGEVHSFIYHIYKNLNRTDFYFRNMVIITYLREYVWVWFGLYDVTDAMQDS